MSDINQSDLERIKGLLPESDAEATKRYIKYKSIDPFPEIAPALLNSADFIDYIIQTGMIYPFHLGKRIKPASYAVPLQGKCVYWENKRKKCVQIINEGEDFILRKNSIAFVTLEPFFRIPDYLALRFNLKIKHIYKGLLLGTGPLVDPGYYGHLSIPLHNFTSNDYTFKGGEDLIFLEFTKLSPNSEWNPSKKINIGKSGIYIPFDTTKIKPGADVEDLLYEADRNNSKVTFLSEFYNLVRRDRRKFTIALYIGLAGIIFSFGAVIYGGYSLVTQTSAFIREEQTRQLDFERELSEKDKKIEYFENQMILINSKIDSLSKNNNENSNAKNISLKTK